VGDGLTEEEQMKAPKGTLFIPYSQFPPKKHRKDCSYHFTPAMQTPTSIENVHSCEVIFFQSYFHLSTYIIISFCTTKDKIVSVSTKVKKIS
jgi:hypothetical protein